VKSFLGQIIGGVAGIALASYLVPGVHYDGNFITLLLIGLILGILNFFIKPVLEVITFPLRLLTLNLFSIVIMMGLVWIADVLFVPPYFEIIGISALFWTALIVWFMSIIFETSLANINTSKN
jgi:putative membrane protein